jgi:hypothetical protein
MNNATTRAGRRRASDRGQPSDALKSADGVAIPVWDADAADPIAYLASVIDVLPGSRPR